MFPGCSQTKPVQLMVVLWTDPLIAADSLLSSIIGLINALLAQSFSFGGQTSLGRFAVVVYCFHFLIIDSMGLHGTFCVLGYLVLHNFASGLC